MGNIFFYNTKIGKLAIAEKYGFITNIYFMNMKLPLSAKCIETKTIKEAYTQLEEYLSGDRKEFDLPLNPSGTDFQQTVWSELLNIKYGDSKSYKDIAIALNADKSFRAVGNACGKNPIPIIIPCHRVICSDNKIAGYVGGRVVLNYLRELENQHVK